jgi:phosphoglycerol transferase MdoB-like AlkP superfamily enzyme
MKRLWILCKIFLLWLLVFVVQKPLFVVWNQGQMSGACSGYDLWQVCKAGFLLDASCAAFLSAIPALLLLCSCFFVSSLKKCLSAYLLLSSLLVSIIFVVNLVLYNFWGFPLDNTVFNYLANPTLVFANVAWYVSVLGIFTMFAMSTGLFLLWQRLVLCRFPKKRERTLPVWKIFVMLAGTSSLFIPMRGGVGVSTINMSTAYHGNNMFLNHAAINPCFSLTYSMLSRQDFANIYHFMDKKTANQYFKELTFATDMSRLSDTSVVCPLLNTTTPNIVFIVLESFGSQVIEDLDGEKGITPNLARWIREGVFFRQLYASSFRTDRGIVSALAGFPAQPTMSILKYSDKVEKLPSIPKSLAQKGYHTSFLYGGDVNFANLKLFPLSQGVTNIISVNDFPIDARGKKWGVPDEITFAYMANKIKNEQKNRYFNMFLTLSSHEPFDVPARKFKNPYLNSVYYTDSCIGAFLDTLALSPAWEHLLVIFVPDHNAHYPGQIRRESVAAHHSFMLWVGGAVQQPCTIDKICSQVDIAATLLAQMQIPHTEFIYSKNVLANPVPAFAFYSFPDGFGLVKEEKSVVYDHAARSIIEYTGTPADTTILLKQGKAFLQTLYEDINEK